MSKHDLSDELRRTFRHGLLRRDGAVIGLWYVTSVGVDYATVRPWVHVLGTSPDGVPWCRSMSAADLDAGRGHHGPGTREERWGMALSRVLGLTRAERSRDRDDLLRWMVEVARIRRPGIGWATVREAARPVFDALAADVEAFVSTLDPTAVETFRSHPADAWTLGDAWPLIDRGMDPEAPLAAALAAHPGLSRSVCSVVRDLGTAAAREVLTSPHELRARLVAQVGCHLSDRLIPAVPRAGRALESLARQVAARGDDGRSALDRLFTANGTEDWAVGVVKDLEHLPAAWVPDGDGQWVAFAECVPLIRSVRSMVPDADLARVLAVGGDWVAWRARLMAVTGADGPDGLEKALHDARHVLVAYEEQVLQPAACASAMAEGRRIRPRHAEDDDQDLGVVATKVLFAGRTLVRVLETSNVWHRRQATMRAAVAALPGAIDDGAEWPAGLPDAEVGDVSVRVLRSQRHLTDEGSAVADRDGVPGLGNCLGGYANKCRSGASRVVSLRRTLSDGSFERLSAAELSLLNGVVEVVEHSGPGNGRASDVCRAALNDYVDGLRSGRLAWEAPEPVQVVEAGLSAIERTGGFDPYDEATRLAVQDLWAPFVPKPLRRMDGDLIAALDHWDDRTAWTGERSVEAVLARAAEIAQERVGRTAVREGDPMPDAGWDPDVPF